MNDFFEGVLAYTGIIFIIILVIGGITAGVYINKKIKYDNFQATIEDLSPEQKCIHICGFQFPGTYFENYKFCMEKCDRISERHNNCDE